MYVVNSRHPPLISMYGRRAEDGSNGEASGKGTACATPEGSGGGDNLSYQELEDENGGDGLPREGSSLPGSDMPETGNRREEAVGTHHSSIGGDSDGGGAGGDGDELAKEKEEPGVWGPGGLLAIPNVKMVLFLACAVQVTYTRNSTPGIYLQNASFVGAWGQCMQRYVGKVWVEATVLIALRRVA